MMIGLVYGAIPSLVDVSSDVEVASRPTVGLTSSLQTLQVKFRFRTGCATVADRYSTFTLTAKNWLIAAATPGPAKQD
ncbi:hypothetical protein DD238_006163 [Peronospora effusa]|uniref:Uncharacterized protein n=1 Tax=Peronospora effusa TaxID=542832 RepID=A0A3M6VS55_9STRA|nr:hypothetical protein DD238_006163 [Peronospora effusa]